MNELKFGNAIYEQIDPEEESNYIAVKENESYGQIKKQKKASYKSFEAKLSNKKIVVVIIFTLATFVLLLVAVAASTGYALFEISKLKTKMASSIFQQDLISKLDSVSQQMNNSIEVFQQQVTGEFNSRIQLLQDLLTEKIATFEEMNATIRANQQLLQNVSALSSNLRTSTEEQYGNVTQQLEDRIVQTQISSNQQYFTLSSRIDQVQTSCQNATQQTAAYISVLQQQSAQNDSTLDARIEVITDLLRENNFICGGTSGWRRVGFLDMTDPSQSCPSGLALKFYSPGLRSCGRATHNTGCWSTFYSVGGSQYSRVCGRVRGYQFGATAAFNSPSTSIDGAYVTGASLTHGASGRRTHIWTFASGLAEVDGGRFSNWHCPCVASAADPPPSFVGNDYFCESGLNRPRVDGQWIFYPNDPLWDGENCVSSCCEFNNPPYFVKTLSAPTTDHIELRICDRSYNENSDAPIDQLELYVQ